MSLIKLPHGARLALVVAAFSLANTAHAHLQAGSLGAAASATDYWQVTCSDDGNGPPTSLMVQIADSSANGAKTSAMVLRGNLAKSTTDLNDADGGAAYSPFVSINAGAGVYSMFVTHSDGAADAYRIQFHCMTGADGTGVHTGTSTPVIRQNQ